MSLTRPHKLLVLFALAAAALLVGAFSVLPDPGAAQPLLSPQLTPGVPELSFTQRFTGLDDPVHITHAKDSSGRIYIVERAGRIRLVKGGVLQPADFLDIAGRVGDANSEQGLLSAAFPPEYALKGYFYVYYTDNSGDTVVSRFYLSADPDLADPDSEEIILQVDQPYVNHNGGQIAFGPDGYLYIGLGDGGDANDPLRNGQTTNTLLGKLLRIDVEPLEYAPILDPRLVYLPVTRTGDKDPVPAYRIPPDNPYINNPAYRPEIWALGLRNPWRFSFDRLTGDLYLGDVGQGSWEEIDHQAAASPGGENYGWRCREGAHNTFNAGECTGLTLVDPVAEYANDASTCAVTGGFVYRGSLLPTLGGTYVYADYCSGKFWGLTNSAGWLNQPLNDTGYVITTFGEGEAGELYFSDYNTGIIYQITGYTPGFSSRTSSSPLP